MCLLKQKVMYQNKLTALQEKYLNLIQIIINAASQNQLELLTMIVTRQEVIALY